MICWTGTEKAIIPLNMYLQVYCLIVAQMITPTTKQIQMTRTKANIKKHQAFTTTENNPYLYTKHPSLAYFGRRGIEVTSRLECNIRQRNRISCFNCDKV